METLRFIGEVVTILSTLVGLYLLFKKELKKRRIEEEQLRKEDSKRFKELHKEIQEIRKDIVLISNQQNVNEKDRIRQDILNFAEKLRVNRTKPQFFNISLHSFTAIFEEYDKYKYVLGGNGYVDEEMEFIIEEMHKYQ